MALFVRIQPSSRSVVGSALWNAADRPAAQPGGDYQWKSSLQLLYFPPNRCGEQQVVIDNDIEIDRPNPFPQFKVPRTESVHMQSGAEMELGSSCR